MGTDAKTILKTDRLNAIISDVAHKLVKVGIDQNEGLISLPMLYPGGSPVVIRVRPVSDNFLVSDSGYGYMEAEHLGGIHTFGKIARGVAEDYGVHYDGRMMFTAEVSREYLPNAVIFTGSASRRSVEMTAEKLAEHKHDSRKQQLRTLLKDVFKDKAAFEVEYNGHSSKTWSFDAMVQREKHNTLFDIVTPNNVSVNGAIVKFQDIARLETAPRRFAILSNKERMKAADLSMLSETVDTVNSLDIPPDELLRAA